MQLLRSFAKAGIIWFYKQAALPGLIALFHKQVALSWRLPVQIA
ncbi:hypothetical protein [Dyadobacter sp. 3J3]|nr:hypothetical protein [Dyadobacter sp. 3J3]